MTRWLIGSSMKLRLVVVVVAALMMIFGFTQLQNMPVDVLPEFSRPFVEVQTEALGLSAQEVEAMITTPMEADMLNGTPWVEEIRSQSLPGLSSIVLVFEEGTDIMSARQVVQENLTEVFALPNVSNPPVMLQPISSANRAMEVGLTSDELSLIQMSVLARWTIVPRLMGLPGVANVSIWGQRKRQLQVQVDPERLRDEGVTLLQVIKSAGNALWASPLSFLEASSPGTGGWIDTPNQRLGVRHLLPITTAEDLAQVSVEGAESKRLGDVATVVEEHQPLIGDAFVNDAPGLMLVVEKFPWANTTAVTEEVEQALENLAPGLSGMQMDSTLFRPATYVEQAIDNLSSAMVIGALLMIAGLFVFLRDWRSALISVVTIVLSVIAAVSVLYMRGVELNAMIVAGLMLALAAIIDDAIIDAGQIKRRLRQAGNGKSSAAAIFEAAVEMRSPLGYATLIMMVAVAPFLALESVSGAFYGPLFTSYMLALVASFLVSSIIAPALSLFLLGASSREGSSAGETQPSSLNGSFLWAARVPRAAFVVVCLVVSMGLFLVPFERQESVLPDLKETNLVVSWEGGSGVSHPAMSRVVTRASRELRAIPDVANVSAHVGRAIHSDQRTDVDAGQIFVSLEPDADYDATVAAIEGVVAGYPGLSREVQTYLQARVREELAGTSSSLVVRVYGEDMNVIRQKADEVQKVLAGINGITDSRVEYPRERPSLEIEVDLERAKAYGIKPGDVRRPATSLVSGIEVGNLFEEQKVFDVIVLGTPNTRHSLTSIQNLLIDTPSGGHVRLHEVADVRIVPTVEVINRDAVARRVDVSANVAGRDLAAVAADVERGIEGIEFPLEYRAELVGEYAERLAAQERLRAFLVAAAIGVLLLLQAFFRSWRLAGVVFVSLPIAILGGALLAFATGGGAISLGSLVGFVAVLGMAVRNATSLVNYYRLLEREGQAFGAELIQRGTADRLGSVLTSAVATALVMLPLTLFGDIAGLEILRPMAIVVLGGLITSTLYTLVVVPGAYLLFGADREAELDLQPSSIGEGDLGVADATPAGS